MIDQVRLLKTIFAYSPLRHFSWPSRVWAEANLWFEAAVLPTFKVAVQEAVTL
jgi:hypothetical protein